MSGYTLASGQRTVTSTLACPTCATVRLATKRYREYVPSAQLCCSPRCMAAYLGRIQAAVKQWGSPAWPEEMVEKLSHGVLPEWIAKRIQGG